MAGITTAALIGLGGTALATGAGLYSSSKQQGVQQQGIDAASANQANQLALQQAMMDRQYKLATSGQTDVRGDQLVYDPTSNTWKSILSPEGQALLSRSDAITRMQDVQTLGRGASEQSANYQRRLAEGSTASPLLDAIKYGYGAPTREGVTGANAVAAATGASEAADQARAGYTGAALRTGFGYAPLEQTLASVDRGATAGVRSGIANAAANRGAYDTALQNFQGGKANLYNAIATRASNTENIPFTPSPIPGQMDSATLNRAVRGPTSTMNPYAGSALNTASNSLVDQIGKQTQLPIGQDIGTLTSAIQTYLKGRNSGNTGNAGAFTGTIDQGGAPLTGGWSF